MTLYKNSAAYICFNDLFSSHELCGINNEIGKDLSQDCAVSETSNETDVDQRYYFERHNFPARYREYNTVSLPLSYFINNYRHLTYTKLNM